MISRVLRFSVRGLAAPNSYSGDFLPLANIRESPLNKKSVSLLFFERLKSYKFVATVKISLRIHNYRAN